MSVWFGKQGLAQLASAQQKGTSGITAVTATMIGAYKQFDDIEFLLAYIPEVHPGNVEIQERIDKIRERHEKYRAAAAYEVLPGKSS